MVEVVECVEIPIGEIGVGVGEVDLLERGGSLMGDEGSSAKEELLCSSGDGGLLGLVSVIEKIWERRGFGAGGVVGSVLVGESVRVVGAVLVEVEQRAVLGELIGRVMTGVEMVEVVEAVETVVGGIGAS